MFCFVWGGCVCFFCLAWVVLVGGGSGVFCSSDIFPTFSYNEI